MNEDLTPLPREPRFSRAGAGPRGRPDGEKGGNAVQTYIVKIRYSEIVRGERREFRHEVSAVERSPQRAIDLALEYFAQLARDSWVGWSRTVEGVEVRPVRSRSGLAAGLTLTPLRRDAASEPSSG